VKKIGVDRLGYTQWGWRAWFPGAETAERGSRRCVRDRC
jgi:hypothetical protein